jgi:hypothetical protein
MDLHKQETAKLINMTDKTGKICLTGSLAEKKKQLLKRLKTIDEISKKETPC